MKDSLLDSSTKTGSEQLGKRIEVYALAATTAGVSVLALLPSAEAEIVYTPANQNIGVNSSLNLDLNHDGIADFQLWNEYSFRNAIEAKLGVKPMLPANRIAGNSEFVAALPGGVAIGGDARFPKQGDGIMIWWFYSFSTSICCGSYGPWRHAKDRYLGLKLSVNGEIHYGWARLTTNLKGTQISATLTGYAYETVAGQAIDAGQTKENSAAASISTSNSVVGQNKQRQAASLLGLLALGSIGQPFWRRDETSS